MIALTGLVIVVGLIALLYSSVLVHGITGTPMIWTRKQVNKQVSRWPQVARVKSLPETQQKQIAFQEMCGVFADRTEKWSSQPMDEAEWKNSTDPARMLDFLVAGPASNRKLRLFACACARRFLSVMPTQACLEAVEIAEKYADGIVTEEKMTATRQVLKKDISTIEYQLEDGDDYPPEYWACRLAQVLTNVDAPRSSPLEWWNKWPANEFIPAAAWKSCLRLSKPESEHGLQVFAAEESAQCDLLREIFGNPFADPRFPECLCTPDVMEAANVIYDKRLYNHLPDLANLLEGSGYRNKEVVDHLRDTGQHSLGCWALDLIIGNK